MLSLGAPIQKGIGSLDPKYRVDLETYILQDVRDEERERKSTSFERWIMK